MKKVLPVVAFLLVAVLIYSFVLRPSQPAVSAGGEGDLKWHTWEEAVAANKKEPRKILVDVYTDWCGWCKRMDATTFQDQTVMDYLKKNFYAVKLDAEQKRTSSSTAIPLNFRPMAAAARTSSPFNCSTAACPTPLSCTSTKNSRLSPYPRAIKCRMTS
ncbi:MAG: DUF255 domain-containing protein [Saprospirales bacterium]|nr:DUF255 domain-containing protein [Saprospirales bacterium]